jgi:hypothetical protein
MRETWLQNRNSCLSYQRRSIEREDMAILNEGYVFERDAPPNARLAFDGFPTRKLFTANMEFCRFVTAENRRTGDKGNQIFGSPWWFTKEALGEIVKRSDPRGLGIGDVARIRLAVSKEFNPKMEWICVIYLTQPVYGWSGKAARQLATEAANVFLAGGETKVFLPHLAGPSDMASKYAQMRFFGMCPDHF